MLQQGLYEESATCQREKSERRMWMIFHVFSLICFTIALILVVFSFSFIPGMITTLTGATRIFTIVTWLLGIALVAGMGWIFWRFKRRFNLSFDLTFVQDELRITKVFNGKRRKHLSTLRADQILKIGYFESDSYERTLAGYKGKPVYCTPNREPSEEKIFIYVLTSGSIGKSLYVIECRKMLLELLVRAAGINKFERQ